MAYKGPSPKPTALKIREGNLGKRPLPANEPTPEAATPNAPSHLSKEARKEWRRIVPELEKLGLLTRIDRSALAAYCSSYALWQEAELELQANGLVVTTPNGHLQTSPYVSIRNRALAQLRQFIQEFGLSPASRTRVSGSPPDDPDDDFFKE